MSRKGLDLSEGQVQTGLDLTRAEAVELNATELVTVTPEDDGWRVTAGQWVGALSCGDLEVRVTPKVGAVKVLQLLARADGVHLLRTHGGHVGISDDADIGAVLAVLFEREANAALAQGIPRGYRSDEQSLPVVRGRIRLVDQLLRRFGAVTPIEVTVDEWTVDTEDNRRLRAATQRLLQLPGVPAPAVTGLRRVDRMLTGVTVPARGSRFAPWVPTRLHVHLHALQRLGEIALAHGGVENLTGDVLARGFRLNLASTFEKLIAQLLAENCRHTGLHRLQAQRELALDQGAELTMRPDLVLVDQFDHPVAVADTKYKQVDDTSTVPNADVYQLVTYCLRLGIDTGHLIYVGDRAPLADRFVIRGSDVNIRVHAIDLTAGIADIESQVQALYARMVGPAP